MRMSFEDAVRKTPELADAFRKGLQALREADRNRIACRDSRRLAGSVNLDAALADAYPNEPRWDYGIALKDAASHRVLWVEVHPASSNHVRNVIDKSDWLMRWLKASALALKQFRRELIWIGTGHVAIAKNSPQRRMLAAAGIRFVGKTLTV